MPGLPFYDILLLQTLYDTMLFLMCNNTNPILPEKYMAAYLFIDILYRESSHNRTIVKELPRKDLKLSKHRSLTSPN